MVGGACDLESLATETQFYFTVEPVQEARFVQGARPARDQKVMASVNPAAISGDSAA